MTNFWTREQEVFLIEESPTPEEFEKRFGIPRTIGALRERRRKILRDGHTQVKPKEKLSKWRRMLKEKILAIDDI